jgi:hypothetical protein
MTACLDSHEIIPENLLPLSPSSSGHVRQPVLSKLHAEHRSAYLNHTSRLAFSLDIPSDGTPAFLLSAGEGGRRGGLEWRVKLAFLVATIPPMYRNSERRSVDYRGRKSMDERGRRSFQARRMKEGAEGVTGVSMIPIKGDLKQQDEDNQVYIASNSLAPMTRNSGGEEGEGGEWLEWDCETIECEIPVRILAGNTAFLVRPSIYVV